MQCIKSFFLVVVLVLGCGGGNKSQSLSDNRNIPEAKIESEDMVSRSILHTAQLTTAVDQKRYRVAGPVVNEFEPSQPIIYLVGKLRKLPTQAQVEVRWFRDSDLQPMLTSEVFASATYSFIASFQPTRKEFVPGTYSVRVFIDGTDIGGESFVIKGIDPLDRGVVITKLQISSDVSNSMKPKGVGRSFDLGINLLHATFKVKDATPETMVTVRWFRKGTVFSQQDLNIEGTGRFGAHIESPSQLPAGKYNVELLLDEKIVGQTSFVIGSESIGPSIDQLSLGSHLGANQMPVTPRTIFSKGETIACGLRFLDLEPNSVITVQWILAEENNKYSYHTTKTSVENGGSGVMGAVWDPEESALTGTYKVVASIGEEQAAELFFTIE